MRLSCPSGLVDTVNELPGVTLRSTPGCYIATPSGLYADVHFLKGYSILHLFRNLSVTPSSPMEQWQTAVPHLLLLVLPVVDTRKIADSPRWHL